MGSVWRDASSIADLGQNMAAWLEGRGPDWPGYDGAFGQEEENGARHLIPTLVAANRAGYVTTCSQPATDDGRGDRQRAFVEGVIHDRSPLLGRIVGLQRQGFTVLRGWPQRTTVVTEDDGQPFTTIGGFRLRRDDVTREWHGVGRHALRELKEHGVRIHVIDMTWGRDDRLWPALANSIR